jgi:hypothetical protein
LSASWFSAASSPVSDAGAGGLHNASASAR